MKKNSFIEGTIIATIAIILVKILGMLYVIPFYATIGIQGSALYAYAYNVYVIFLDISSAGIPVAISKIISEYNTLGMLDAKTRAFKVGKKIVSFISISAFITLFLFAQPVAKLIIGSLSGGNTISDVTFVIRCISFAVLVIPYLSVAKGYLQGHNFIAPSSISQVIEQVVRICFILIGSTLALKVLKLSLTTAVGIAVFGAFVGGFSALLYVYSKIKANKKKLNLEEKYHKDDVTNKEIGRKIIAYAIPFVIINIANSIYNFISMVLTLRTLDYLNYKAADVELITSAITTWAPKLNMIIGALSMGMSVSLIPIIGAAFTLKKWDEVNDKLNKALQIILIISIPMAIGISMLSEPVWRIFYGHNPYGTNILMLNIFVAVFINLSIVTGSTLQSLNKFKIVYLSTISGIIINTILAVPLMLLYHKIGIPAYFGTITSTIIGYIVTIAFALGSLHKAHQMSYKETYKTLTKLIIPTISLIAVIIALTMIVPYNINSRLSCLLYVSFIAVVGAFVYLSLTYKIKVLSNAFGQEYINRIIKKLTFNKVSKN